MEINRSVKTVRIYLDLVTREVSLLTWERISLKYVCKKESQLQEANETQNNKEIGVLSIGAASWYFGSD